MNRAKLAGGGVMSVLGALLLLNVIWVGGHCGELRPYAKGDVAPEFTLPRADGAGFGNLVALRGHVVLIDFWATWCGPCRETMPALERVYERHHAEGLEILSVNTDGGRAAAEKALGYARRLGLTFPVYVDDGHVAAQYRVDSIPHMVIVDKEGVIRDVHIGVLSVKSLERDLDDTVTALQK